MSTTRLSCLLFLSFECSTQGEIPRTLKIRYLLLQFVSPRLSSARTIRCGIKCWESMSKEGLFLAST